MQYEYEILKCFEKTGNMNLYPNKEKVEELLSNIVNFDQISGIVEKLSQRNLIEEKHTDRIGLTKAGYNYLDEKYEKDQVYEIVDNALALIRERNEFIPLDHKRGNHNIQLQAREIFEDYGLNKILNPSKPHFSLSQITKRGRDVIAEGGIKNYLNKLNKSQTDSTSIKIETQQLEDQIRKLTLSSLQYENENRDLKTKLANIQIELAEAQKADIPINAIDRKTLLHWQIATGVVLIVGFIIGYFFKGM